MIAARFGFAARRTVASIFACVIIAAPAFGQESPSSSGDAQAPRFSVWEYRVLGNSTLSNSSIESALYPQLGPDKSMVDVETARAALEKRYHDEGFGTVFVDIPEQSVDDGIVRLHVTEGRIDRVRIIGARYFANGQIRAAVPELEGGTVPNLPKLQSQLSDLNGVTSDRVVTPVLKAGRIPGAIDVELKVTDELPLHASLEVNDRYSLDTSRLRTMASVSYTNLWQAQHNFTLQYQTAPEDRDEVETLVASYAFRVPSLENMTFAIYGVNSNTDVATFGTLSVLGDGKILGVRAIYSLPFEGGDSHSFTIGLDYKDFFEDIRLTLTDGLATPIQYLNSSLSYSGTIHDDWLITGINVGANFGMREVVNDPRQFEEKRFKGAANYMYLRAGIEEAIALPHDWSIIAKISGQFTQNPLVSNEQLAIGGADTVRGYLEATRLGDYGGVGTIEIRQISPSRWLSLPAGKAYVAVFYDAGSVAILSPLPSQSSRFDLASAGLGMRIFGWYKFDFALDWARALKAAGTVKAGDDRAHFSVRYLFN